MQDTKKPWFSKSIILGLVGGLASTLAVVLPQANVVSEFIKTNGAALGMAWGLLAIVFRWVSKDKIQLTE